MKEKRQSGGKVQKEKDWSKKALFRICREGGKRLIGMAICIQQASGLEDLITAK